MINTKAWDKVMKHVVLTNFDHLSFQQSILYYFENKSLFFASVRKIIILFWRFKQLIH